jgi:hypothetical protein
LENNNNYVFIKNVTNLEYVVLLSVFGQHAGRHKPTVGPAPDSNTRFVYDFISINKSLINKGTVVLAQGELANMLGITNSMKAQPQTATRDLSTILSINKGTVAKIPTRAIKYVCDNKLEVENQP